jgi:hypothetical protein
MFSVVNVVSLFNDMMIEDIIDLFNEFFANEENPEDKTEILNEEDIESSEDGKEKKILKNKKDILTSNELFFKRR